MESRVNVSRIDFACSSIPSFSTRLQQNIGACGGCTWWRVGVVHHITAAECVSCTATLVYEQADCSIF